MPYNYESQKKIMMEEGKLGFLKILIPMYNWICEHPKGCLFKETELLSIRVMVSYSGFEKRACLDMLVELNFLKELATLTDGTRIFEKIF